VQSAQGPPPSSATQFTLTASQFQGPIPPPEALARYNEILPDAAERILAMAERQETHRHDLETKVIDSGIRATKRGQVIAFLVALSGMGLAAYLACLGQPWQAIAALGGNLASMVAVFVIGRTRQEKEREARRAELDGGLAARR
jgi:uncharacterized membrane protein